MRVTPNLFLILTATALLAANWAVRHSQGGASQLGKADAGAASNPTAGGPAKQPSGASPAPAAENARGENGAPPRFNWASVEVSDYKEYAQRLKAVGFPPELVRDIVIADMNKLYEARERALELNQVPYDAPMSQRQTHNISPEDWQRVKDLRDLRMEKQMALESILGEYVPREILHTPISRNYEAYDYAISQLPPDKREPVQDAQETEIYVEGYNKTHIGDHDAELASFKQTREERDQAMLKVLTPEEFERYEMFTEPAGTELARRVIGMQPTDEEFQAMYRIAYKDWIDTGGVYGRWRAMPVPQEQIEAADREMDQQLSQALGPERFVDYQMAINETGQQMRNFAARFELPRNVMVEAFQLQIALDGSGRSQSSQGQGTVPAQSSDVQSRLQQLLGAELWQNWQVGRLLRANLDP